MKNKPYNIEDGARALVERAGWHWDSDMPHLGGSIDPSLPENYDKWKSCKAIWCGKAQAVIDTLPIVFLEEGAEPQHEDVVSFDHNGRYISKVTASDGGLVLNVYTNDARYMRVCDVVRTETPIEDCPNVKIIRRDGKAVVYVKKGEA